DEHATEHLEMVHAREHGFLEEARSLRASGKSELDAGEALTLDVLIDRLESLVATNETCHLEQWNVTAWDNPVADWNSLPQRHIVTTYADATHLVARYGAIPRAIDTNIENLRRGLAAGAVANATSTRIALDMVNRQLARPDAEWPLMAPAKKERADWSEANRLAFARDVTAAIAQIRAATVRWRDFVTAEVLPKARPDDRVGVRDVPGGVDCYAASIRRETSLAVSADALHALGLSEIARIDDEMRTLGEKLFGTRDLVAIAKRLRTDPALYFKTEEEVEAKAVSALAASKAKLPRYFGILPKADCVVQRIPDYEAPYTTIAYYLQPNADGSKPGEYFVNTYQPATRPRFEAEVLAFHESIPGHHVQIAIAQELPETPAFRKFLGSTAFVEGWGLYTERLADEIGLYSSDLDRMGMLSFDAWRASRLVVDTGMHAKGWSREQAVTFMLEHTALAENNIRNEVDRYSSWPAQALAYKVGQQTLLRLRAEARARLGAQFDLKAFHDTVLGAGAVPLPMLEKIVRAWMAKNTTQSAPAGAQSAAP
ncbi:MAG TPA: DUF885 domain-containing protein, partial [Polyangiaceae bacterium]|nr:DUF885 domain-containing protein [Polyangiaceae bacterium]